MFTISTTLMLVALSICAYEDVKSRELTRWSILFVALVTMLQNIFLAVNNEYWQIGENILTAIFTFVIYIVCMLIAGTNGIGGGDIKIMITVSAFLGFSETVIFVIIHSLLALIYVVFKRVAHKVKITSVPLMVFIFYGFIITKLFLEVI